MGNKVFRTETLSAARRWVDRNYKVSTNFITQKLRDDLVNGLNDPRMDTMWERHRDKDKIVIMFNDDHGDTATIVYKLGFRGDASNDVQEFAQITESTTRTWRFNYNL